MTPLEELGTIFARLLRDEHVYKHAIGHTYTSSGELCIDGWISLSAPELALIEETINVR